MAHKEQDQKESRHVNHLHDMETSNRIRGNIPLVSVREGVSLPWMVSTRALKAIKEYEIRSDDVLVITYPKSGTHWITEIVHLVLANGDEDKIDRKKQPICLESDDTQPGAVIPSNLPPEDLVPFFERCKSWPSPRVFMTHLNQHLIPEQIREGKGKVIFVTRNPKDAAVSLWHFWDFRPPKLVNPQYKQWDSFFEVWLTEDIPFGTWFTYTLQYWNKHRYDKNFLFLKYEDMKQDPRVAVEKVAKHLEHPLSDEAVDRIVKLISVDSMRERFNAQGATSGKPTKGMIGVPDLMRKGVVGDWKTHFTVAQNETFDKMFREKMEGTDLHIDFELP